MSVGAIYAPITGGIDLSVGSIAALAGIVANVLMNVYGLNWMLAIFITLLIGVLLNGMTIMDLDVQTQNIVKGIVLLVAIVLDSILHPRDEETSKQGD